jgi:hypothetical protein
MVKLCIKTSKELLRMLMLSYPPMNVMIWESPNKSILLKELLLLVPLFSVGPLP